MKSSSSISCYHTHRKFTAAFKQDSYTLRKILRKQLNVTVYWLSKNALICSWLTSWRFAYRRPCMNRGFMFLWYRSTIRGLRRFFSSRSTAVRSSVKRIPVPCSFSRAEAMTVRRINRLWKRAIICFGLFSVLDPVRWAFSMAEGVMSNLFFNTPSTTSLQLSPGASGIPKILMLKPHVYIPLQVKDLRL